MRKALLLFAILLVSFSNFAGAPPLNHRNSHPAAFKKETYVYICNSNGAYAYHSSKTCRGLNRCTHEILKVTLADAVKVYKRKPCKICE
jgi:hypothetical protein